MPSSRTILRLALAVVLFVIAMAARKPFCSDDLFTFDAADYMRADRNGFWAQYTGTDAVPVISFLKNYRADAAFHMHPWGLLYQQNDGAALRHFHVPVGFYIPALIQQAGGSRRMQRAIVAAISAVTIASIFLMLCYAEVSILTALLCSLFLCWCPVLIVAGTMFSPHALFSLTAIACMFALCRWLETLRTKWLVIFSIACGVSIGTLELSPILVFASLSTLLIGWWKSRDRPLRVPLGKTLLWLLASGVVAAALWPGGVVRGGYLLSYGVFVFQGLFRSALYFQQRSLPSSVYRLGQSWIIGTSMVALLAVSIATTLYERKSIPLIGFSTLSLLLFVQGLANGFRNTTYASHAVFCILIATALSIHALGFHKSLFSKWVSGTTLGAVAVLTVACAIGFLHITPEAVAHDPNRIAGAIQEIRTYFKPGTTFVANEDPQAFIAYAPGFQFFGAASATSPAPEPWVRLDRYYLLFDREAGQPPAGVAFCDKGKLKDYGFLVSCQVL